MGPGVEEAAAPPVHGGSGPMRIFIGGVSTTLTAADMEKTFSSLGRVAGVDLIRTNGRSFAYMDFEPASDRALAKLFSMYNGCVWKGGKLKLEKAKEHYLTRLKKEWEEDANPIPITPANPIPENDVGHLKKLDFLKQEKAQINIFFPKLRKVKSLPFKGTGKHKYSFQRIEISSSLPIHFCDCEEHCDPHEIASEKYQSFLNKVINEKELCVMNSVMNKLLEKECNGAAAEEMVKSSRGTTISDTKFDFAQSEEAEEDQGADADNLVTNIGVGGIDDILMHLKGGQAQSLDQETRRGKLRPFKEKENPRKRKTHGSTGDSEITRTKKFHPVSVEKSAEDEFTPILSRNISSQGYPQESEISPEVPPIKSQTELDMDTSQSKKGVSWLQKSSWKDLIGKNDGTSFSISSHLPGVNPMAPKAIMTNDSAIALSTLKNKRKARSGREESLHREKSKEGDGIQANPEGEKTKEGNRIETNPEGDKSKEEDGIQANPEGFLVAQDNDDMGPTSPRLAYSGQDAIITEDLSISAIAVSSSAKKRKSRSGREEPGHMGKSNEEDGIPANPEGSIETPDNDEVGPTPFQLGSFGQDAVTSEDCSQEPEAIAGPSRKVNSWLQKSSWTDLVGDKDSGSFSISSILPGIATSASTLTKSNSSASTISTEANNRKVQFGDERSKSIEAKPNTIPLEKATEPRHDNTFAKPGEGGPDGARENGDVVSKGTTPMGGTRGGCTFMRSDESMKEWGRLKSLLSGYVNKKSVEKDASKSLGGMPSRKR